MQSRVGFQKIFLTLVSIAGLVAVVPHRVEAQARADYILHNGKIFTVDAQF